jgi:hypothetical protein
MLHRKIREGDFIRNINSGIYIAVTSAAYAGHCNSPETRETIDAFSPEEIASILTTKDQVIQKKDKEIKDLNAKIAFTDSQLYGDATPGLDKLKALKKKK